MTRDPHVFEYIKVNDTRCPTFYALLFFQATKRHSCIERMNTNPRNCVTRTKPSVLLDHEYPNSITCDV